MIKLLIFSITLLLSSNIFAATNFKLDPNGFSHVYFPINDDKSKWYIAGGSPSHRGSDTYADDWNLKSIYHVEGQSSNNCNRDKGATVISSFAGTVIRANTQVSVGYGKEVVIRSSVNPNFAMRYAHLDTVKVAKGDKVNAGTLLGTVGNTGTKCAHLHLVLYKNLNSRAIERLKRGNSPQSLNGRADTFAAKFHSDATFNDQESILDGIGSVIHSDTSCYGCDYDAAIMHPHPKTSTKPMSTRSTVFFQWKTKGRGTDVSKCPFLKIGIADRTNLRDISNTKFNVEIKTKQWSDEKPRSAFKTTLPLTIKPEDNNWTLVSVTSETPISDSKTIVAGCVTRPINKLKKASNLDFVYLTSGYFWGGNGSIITDAGEKSFGITYDLAIRSTTKNTLTAFQWQSSAKCSSLKLELVEGEFNIPAQSSGRVTQVDMKQWSIPWNFDIPNKPNFCANGLPCTLKAPKIGEFFIIKVKIKSSKNSTNPKISASCQ